MCKKLIDEQFSYKPYKIDYNYIPDNIELIKQYSTQLQEYLLTKQEEEIIKDLSKTNIKALKRLQNLIEKVLSRDSSEVE